MTVYGSGIDVSRYQGSVDFNRVAMSGKSFVIARAVSSSGGVYIDPTSNTNIANAQAAGLRTGAYYFTYATSTAYADSEIALLLEALEGKQLQYPVFIDVEASSIISIGREALTQLVLYALKKITAAGYLAGVFTYADYAEQWLDMAQLAAYPLWLSDYDGVINFPDSYDMLQYSDTGVVDGVTGKVDLDVSYTDFLPTILQQGLNGYAAGGTPVEMTSAAGLSLTVFGSKNCQYFYTANVNDIVGTLPHGTYPAVQQSVGCYGGFSWVTIQFEGKVYWTALLSDRCYLIKT